MKWQKAPEELKLILEKATNGIECEKRLMFGFPAYFINGNMFAGLFQSFLFLRLSPDQVAELRKKDPSLSALEPMPGRPMKQYFVIPRAMHQDVTALGRVTRGAAEHTRSLAPKKKVPKEKTAKKKTIKKKAGRGS